MGETVRLTREWAPAAALLTFDRPGALNAVDGHVLDDLERAIETLEADREARAVVLTGNGRAFVGGGDIAHMAAIDPDEGERFVYRGQAVLRRLERLPQVTVAAINGYALGGGFEIALACDLRVAAESAELGLPEVSVGVIPGWGGTQRLVRLAGRGIAKDLIFTGRRVGATEALALGLVSRVVPSAVLLDTCRELCATIVGNSALAVRQAKKAIDQGADLGLDEGLSVEAEAWLVNFCSADRVEGLRAFLERRPPRYRGRHATRDIGGPEGCEGLHPMAPDCAPRQSDRLLGGGGAS